MPPNLLYLLLVFDRSLGCSPPAFGYVYETQEQQSKNAGVILIGKVESSSGNIGNQSVTLTEVDYYKGCGPPKVVVSGFQGSSMCQSDAPEAGRRVLIFACRGAEAGLVVNSYSIGTGTLPLLFEVEKKLNAAFRVQQCSGDRVVAGKCGKETVGQGSGQDQLDGLDSQNTPPNSSSNSQITNANQRAVGPQVSTNQRVITPQIATNQRVVSPQVSTSQRTIPQIATTNQRAATPQPSYDNRSINPQATSAQTTNPQRATAQAYSAQANTVQQYPQLLYPRTIPQLVTQRVAEVAQRVMPGLFSRAQY